MTTTLRLTRATVLAGPRAPESLVLTITPGCQGLDLSTVTTVSLTVSGRASPWSCSVVSQTATELVVEHDFIAGDADTAGEVMTILPILTVPGGTRRAMPFELEVLAIP